MSQGGPPRPNSHTCPPARGADSGARTTQASEASGQRPCTRLRLRSCSSASVNLNSQVRGHSAAAAATLERGARQLGSLRLPRTRRGGGVAGVAARGTQLARSQSFAELASLLGPHKLARRPDDRLRGGRIRSASQPCGRQFELAAGVSCCHEAVLAQGHSGAPGGHPRRKSARIRARPAAIELKIHLRVCALAARSTNREGPPSSGHFNALVLTDQPDSLTCQS